MTTCYDHLKPIIEGCCVLFNSFEFIFFFLPITLFVFFQIGKRNYRRAAALWLVFCSLFFYGWWNPAYLSLILFSTLFNYTFGVMLGRPASQHVRKILLAMGVTVDLGILFYFKYAHFFVEQVNSVFATQYPFEKLILPLGISFFTFQKIAYLVDAYRREVGEYNFLHYCLFVTFFPQLLAGPIVHHKEIMPQFSKDAVYKFNYEHLSLGVTLFTLGLFKKVMFADAVAVYATPVFHAAQGKVAITFFEAWGGALAYTLQLYFDFSGYSDMAIGLAYMFGITLPLNFNSPYQATSIIEFWRRWHITLSRFLRDYLYIALGGNRKGSARRYLNLFLTMLLGGVWHGAGWTFIVWGMLHGIYLIINHAWIKVRKDLLQWNEKVGIVERFAAWGLTLYAIIVGWVYFRSDSIEGANRIVKTMFGLNGISLPSGLEAKLGSYAAWLHPFGVSFNGMFGGSEANFGEGVIWIIGLTVIVLVFPNSSAIKEFIRGINAGPARGEFRPVPLILSAVIVSILFFVSISNLMNISEFLYFNF